MIASTFRASALALALVAAGPVLAQDAVEDDTAVTTTDDAAVTTTDPVDVGNEGGGFDLGWLGLLGLFGLMGLRGNRREATVTTTRAR